MDAVTEQAVRWRDTLRRRGVGGGIFAANVDPAMAGEVHPLGKLRDHPDEAVVLHYSIWSEALERALRIPRSRLAINYQNITPGRLLEWANPNVAALCDRGRRELCRLVGKVSVAIAASSFNAQELTSVGFGDVAVVPLILPAVQSPSNAPPADKPAIITVGRVVPNKRLEDAIRALTVLRAQLLPAATLDVVGGWNGFEPYRVALGRFAARLGVSDAVRFHGMVGDAERDRLYRQSAAYLCTSEHEGFCAPLIEALAAGLPVVARDAGAVRETLGGAGLVLPVGDAPVVAEALHCVLMHDNVRAALALRAQRRLAELEPERVESMLHAALAPILG